MYLRRMWRNVSEENVEERTCGECGGMYKRRWCGEEEEESMKEKKNVYNRERGG